MLSPLRSRFVFAFAFAAGVVVLSAVAYAEPARQAVATAKATEQPKGLQPIDWALIALYACSTIGLGIYFSRRQRTTKEYFTGSGNMNPFFIGVSLFATLLSTISYLSMPGEALGKGPVNLVGLLALPLVFIVVAYGLLPVYMRARVTSAYELLEERLGLSVRLLGASMFLLLRLVWMTLLVYLAAKAMTVMLGVDYWIIKIESARLVGLAGAAGDMSGIVQSSQTEIRIAAVPVIVIVTGLVAVIYTSLGGLRAVVVTDFMQTVLLFGGALLVIGTVTWDFGGFGWFPTQWQENWDSQPIFSFDPRTRVTVVGTILTGAVWYIATTGGDQTSVQRFMATRDAQAARRAFATQLIVAAVVGLTLYMVGFALLGYFQAHASALPADISLKENADDIFPRFISFHLPVGISGLVVAAMFAAAMSSIDSGVNSITAVVMTDYLDRFGLKPKTERGHVRFAQLLALGIGVTVVIGSSFIKYIEGNITAVTSKSVNLLTTPIFGLFFFAMFFRRATVLGVWVGAICGTITAALISFSGPLVVTLATNFDVDAARFGVELMTNSETGMLVTAVRELNPVTGEMTLVPRDPISFQWIGPIALLVNIAAGIFVSLLFPGKPKTLKELKA